MAKIPCDQAAERGNVHVQYDLKISCLFEVV